MADWRDRSAVPDSEDEEESLVFDSSTSRGQEAIGHDEGDHRFQEVEEYAEEEERRKPNFAVVIPVMKKSQLGDRAKIVDATDYHLGDDNDDIDELQQDHVANPPRQEPVNKLHDHVSGQAVGSTGYGLEEQNVVQSNASSPLSSAHPSDVEMPEFMDMGRRASPVSGHQRPISIASQQIGLEKASDLSIPVGSFSDAAPWAFPAPRLLRPRNPIHLHPYAIESEKYKQTLKARGLQPLRIAQEDTQADESEVSGTEEQDTYASPNRESRTSRSGSPNILSSPPQTVAYDFSSSSGLQEPSSNLDEEEFPDFSALLRKPLPQVIRNGFKKVKTSHAYSKQNRRPQREPTLNPQSTSLRHIETSRHGQPLNVFEIPPSPPPSAVRSSSSEVVAPSKNHFRMPPGLVTPQIQTPVASSEAHYPQTHPKKDENDTHAYSSDSEPVRYSDRRQRQISIEDELGLTEAQHSDPGQITHADNSSESSEEDEQFHKVQRKIRGVLPASWLRLDMKKGVQKGRNWVAHKEAEPPQSPEHVNGHRGVARLISRSRVEDHARTKEIAVLISDESSSEREDKSRSHPHAPSSRLDSEVQDLFETPEDRFDWSGSENMEDDRIDHMLQPASRAAAKTKKPQEHQTLLSFGGESPRYKKRNIFKQNETTRRQRTRVNPSKVRSKSSVQTRKARVSKNRLGILDFSEAQTSSKLPASVNLAARSARSRRDLGRQSPSKKFLRLATREDTADVQETLASWRNGALAQRRKSAPPLPDARVALKAIAGNKRSLGPPRGHHHLSNTTRHIPSEADSSIKSPQKGGGTNVENVIQSILDRQRSQGTKKIQVKAGVSRPLPRSSTGRSPHACISTSLHARGSARPALLEILATSGTHAPIGPNSYKTPRPLITTAANPRANPILDRYLQGATLNNPARPIRAADADTAQSLDPGSLAAPTVARPQRKHRPRKPVPRQLDIRNPCYHTAIEIDDEDLAGAEAGRLVEDESSSNPTLFGLGPYGTDYSLDFAIEPPIPGDHFWKPLIDKNLRWTKTIECLKRRSLEKAADEVEFDYFGTKGRWNAWTEPLSSDLSNVIKEIVGVIQSHSNKVDFESQHHDSTKALDALDSISMFFAGNLYFLDPIDRASCTKHLLALIKILLEALCEQIHGLSRRNTEQTARTSRLLRCVSVRMVNIANQVQIISAHELVPTTLRDNVKAIVEQAFRQSVECALSPDLKETWLQIRNSQDLNMYSYDEDGQAVCISELLQAATDLHFEHIFQEELLKVLLDSYEAQLRDVQILERIWRDVFTLLPFFRKIVSSEAVLVPRPKHTVQHWDLIKRLVEPVLESYRLHPHRQAPTFNSYLRVIIGRCVKLIQQWNWRKPEALIGTFFDFFARNNLGNLQHERSHGSPQFLEQLTEYTTPDLLLRDLGFDVFLKLLGVGLRSMREDYPPKKIRDIAWRYMPNHGRNLPKDQSIRQEDLDALRNHHDLLCVLYWASPHDFRPRVTAIQNLVEMESSHREACHINIRAWSNLVRYQLSTDEAITKLESFARWISDTISQILHLHSLARSEVESQAKAAESNGLRVISPGDQEMMISRNQRQVEAILEDAIVQLKGAIEIARTGQAAHALFPGSLSHVLEMFDAKRPRTNGIVIQALETYSTVAQKYLAEQGEPESQNYGDWPALEDENQVPSFALFEEKLLRPVYRILSNSLGADNLLDDGFLVKVINTWIAIVHLAVSQESNSWNDILSPYGTYSWTSLRDTEQTRKYTPYVLASLIKKDNKVFTEHEDIIYKAWLVSCLDRDSMLKFQHVLTGVVLDHSSSNPLFNNMSSMNEVQSDQLVSSISEFRNSRRNLLSSVLANMRENLDSRSYHELGDRTKLKQDFINLIKYMMNTMKTNYEALGNIPNSKGAYVDFVHMVVGLLQQHAADICPVDRFFTDSPDFPAPATDPAYVVNRILNYVHRFGDQGKSMKQLASLVQNLCERAIIDDKVGDLADQLELALYLNGRDDYATKKRLLHFVIHTILPVYVEVAFTTKCGWLLAEPLLLAMHGAFTSLISWVDVSSRDNVDEISLTILTYLDIVYRNTVQWVDNHCDSYGNRPLPSRAFGMTLQTVIALLPLINHLCWHWPQSHLTTDARNRLLTIKWIMRHYKHKCYSGHDDSFNSGHYTDQRIPRPQYDPTTAFVLRELKSALSERWQERNQQNGDIYTRPSLRSEWVKVAEGYSRGADTFLDDFREFNAVLVEFEGLHEDGDWKDEDFRKAKEPNRAWSWRDEALCY